MPEKRVAPSVRDTTRLRKRIYDQRAFVAELSRDAFVEALKADDYSIYSKRLADPLRKLRRLEIRGIFFRAVINRLERLVRSALRRS